MLSDSDRAAIGAIDAGRDKDREIRALTRELETVTGQRDEAAMLLSQMPNPIQRVAELLSEIERDSGGE